MTRTERYLALYLGAKEYMEEAGAEPFCPASFPTYLTCIRMSRETLAVLKWDSPVPFGEPCRFISIRTSNDESLKKRSIAEGELPGTFLCLAMANVTMCYFPIIVDDYIPFGRAKVTIE